MEHNLNLPKLTTSLDGLSESLRNYLSQDAITRAFQYHCQKSPPEKHGFHLRKSKKNRKSTQMHFLVWDW